MALARRLVAAMAAIVLLASSAAPGLAESAGDDVPKHNFFRIEPPVVVPVLSGRRLAGQISFDITLELSPETDRDMVIKRVPRLRNAYLFDLKRYAEQRPEVLRNIQLKSLKRMLLATSTRILGKGEVNAVLVQRAQVNRF